MTTLDEIVAMARRVNELRARRNLVQVALAMAVLVVVFVLGAASAYVAMHTSDSIPVCVERVYEDGSSATPSPSGITCT